mgnify:FL=1
MVERRANKMNDIYVTIAERGKLTTDVIKHNEWIQVKMLVFVNKSI